MSISTERVVIPVYQKKIFAMLMRVRPSQLVSAIKAMCGIRRRTVDISIGGRLAFWVDPVSVFGQHLINSWVYEPAMTQFVTTFLRPGEIFVDVGASEGYFSVLGARCGARVYAVEPQSRMQQILRANFRLNDLLSTVDMCQVLLTDRQGEARIRLRPMTNPGASSLFRVGKIGWRSELLPTTTLDHLVHEKGISRISLMKVDCEGSEHAVIRGASETLRRKLIDFIALEYHPTIGPNAACECENTHCLLKKYGYDLTKVKGLTIYHPEFSAHDLDRLEMLTRLKTIPG